ncbi:hypothetical protein EYR36_012035 [Pleurotus pulmonarius]|nr:hypothetical protein EYR36_012035 [Pleurotus pulmonarius]
MATSIQSTTHPEAQVAGGDDMKAAVVDSRAEQYSVRGEKFVESSNDRASGGSGGGVRGKGKGKGAVLRVPRSQVSIGSIGVGYYTSGPPTVRRKPLLRTRPNTPNDAGAFTQIPYMKEATGVLSRVMAMRDVRGKQDALVHLVDYTSCILLSMARNVQSSGGITEDMRSALEKIKNITLEIQTISDEDARRGRFRHFLYAGSNRVKIARLRDELIIAAQISGVTIPDVTAMDNEGVNELIRHVLQMGNEDSRGPRAGVADSPPPLYTPSELGNSSPVTIQAGHFMGTPRSPTPSSNFHNSPPPLGPASNADTLLSENDDPLDLVPLGSSSPHMPTIENMMPAGRMIHPKLIGEKEMEALQESSPSGRFLPRRHVTHHGKDTLKPGQPSTSNVDTLRNHREENITDWSQSVDAPLEAGVSQPTPATAPARTLTTLSPGTTMGTPTTPTHALVPILTNGVRLQTSDSGTYSRCKW